MRPVNLNHCRTGLAAVFATIFALVPEAGVAVGTHERSVAAAHWILESEPHAFEYPAEEPSLDKKFLRVRKWAVKTAQTYLQEADEQLEWSDPTGKFAVEARYAGHTPSSVALVKDEQSKRKQVPIGKLSKESIDRLTDLTSQQASVLQAARVLSKYVVNQEHIKSMPELSHPSYSRGVPIDLTLRDGSKIAGLLLGSKSNDDATKVSIEQADGSVIAVDLEDVAKPDPRTLTEAVRSAIANTDWAWACIRVARREKNFAESERLIESAVCWYGSNGYKVMQQEVSRWMQSRLNEIRIAAENNNSKKLERMRPETRKIMQAVITVRNKESWYRRSGGGRPSELSKKDISRFGSLTLENKYLTNVINYLENPSIDFNLLLVRDGGGPCVHVSRREWWRGYVKNYYKSLDYR